MEDKNERFKELIERAKEKYGDKFDYSKATYESWNMPVVITCPKHGDFKQTMHTHLNKVTLYGCPSCGEEERLKKRILGKDIFIKKAREVHGDKYDYSKVDYVNNSTNVTITCPIHGEFKQAPSNHLAGKGCYWCGRKSAQNKITSNTEQFIKKAKEKHGDRYDYSKVDYVDNNTKVTIICKKHGEFKQKPVCHLNGSGCQKCGKEQEIRERTLTTEEFIERSRRKHGDFYSYEKVEYVKHDVPVIVTCPIHGDFQVTPDSHIQGCGCRTCSKLEPKAENEIYEFVESLIGKDRVSKHVIGVLNGKQEVDVYSEDKKIGIEYDGLTWHSERFHKGSTYHISKTNKCVEDGINLLHIFEDEYMLKKDLVLNRIKEIFNIHEGKEILFSSTYSLKTIKTQEAKEFYKKYSIEPYKRSTVNIGAFTNKNEPISVISMTKTKRGWIVNNLVNNIKFKPLNIEEKAVEYIIENYNPNKIYWALDRRWYSLGSEDLDKIGFKKVEITKPNVFYIKRLERLTKQEMEKSESKAKFYRIWDCGNLIYEWNKNGSQID